jgi:TetR/AcrR family transcriptional repressor of lmrAB and yxaGH operons
MTSRALGETTTRDRVVAVAAELFRARGVTGTGLMTILERAKAPRGSLYHHFPGGKDELVLEALRFEAARIHTDLRAVLPVCEDESAAIHAFVEGLARSLERSEFRLGCPVSTAALELAAESEAVRAVCAEAYDVWQQLLCDRLGEFGYAPGAAASRAELILATVEGGMLLARARRDADVLRRLAASLTASH